MDKVDNYAISILVLFLLTVGISVWLIKRAKQEKRIHWFLGCSIVTFIIMGIIKTPIAIVSIVVLLRMSKKENAFLDR